MDFYGPARDARVRSYGSPVAAENLPESSATGGGAVQFCRVLGGASLRVGWSADLEFRSTPPFRAIDFVGKLHNLYFV